MVFGMLGAMVFGMLGFYGFDVVSTVAEETKMAHRRIPQATIFAVLLYAVLIIGGIWALTLGAIRTPCAGPPRGGSTRATRRRGTRSVRSSWAA